MEIIFEGLCLGFVMFGILCIFAVGYLATKISVIIMAIIIGILYLLFIGIGIFGAISIKAAYSKAGKILGFILLVLGLTGGFSLFNRDEISDFFMEQKAKQQTAILDNSKTFISLENQCDSEDIEMVEILFTPKTYNSSTVNVKWEQAWPSKSSSVPFELTKIPVSKNDTSFALRLTTKDKTQTVLDEKIFKTYFRHKVYFEPKDINPNEESLIKIVYDGTKLLIKNDNVIKNSEPFFSENTIIFFDLNAMAIRVNDKPVPNSSTKWEKLKKTNSNYNKNYQPLLFNHLDEKEMPLNVTMMTLEPGKDFFISYTDYKTDRRGVNVKKTFTAKEHNLIYVKPDGYTVTYNPNFCKFDYVK